MKVLITGHKGFVGSSIHKRFSEHDVCGIDIKESNDAIDFFKKDETKFDLVFHCAAIVGGRKTIEGQPHRLFENFVLDSMLFQWALKTKPQHVVYYSSSACYPEKFQNRSSIPGYRLKESDIDLYDISSPDPSIYGLSKLCGESLCHYSKNEDTNFHVFRPFSGYSENQSLDYPFPSFIKRARDKSDPFEIWGDGNQVRDWIHIEDIVDGTLAAIDNNVKGPVNLCTGVGTSFNDFADKLITMAGYSPKIKHLTTNPVGVQYRVGDPTKLNEFFVPKISFEQGIERALREYK